MTRDDDPPYWVLISVLFSSLPLTPHLARQLHEAAYDLHRRDAGMMRIDTAARGKRCTLVIDKKQLVDNNDDLEAVPLSFEERGAKRDETGTTITLRLPAARPRTEATTPTATA